MDTTVSESNYLLDWKPQVLETWVEWQEAWQDASVFNLRLGLLHSIMDVGTASQTESGERLVFLLQLAEGHTKTENFVRDEPRRTYVDARWRQELAQKAFQVLLKHLFTNSTKFATDEPSWSQAMQYPGVFDGVASFVLVSSNTSSWSQNLELDDGYHRRDQDVVKRFKRNFCTWAWEFTKYPTYNQTHRYSDVLQFKQAFNEQLAPIRARLVPLLYEQGLLYSTPWRRHGDEAAVTAALRMSALGSDAEPTQEQLEDAFFKGRTTAGLLLMLAAYDRAATRDLERREAVEAERREERRLRDLAVAEDEAANVQARLQQLREET
jgi:hypothetical protein